MEELKVILDMLKAYGGDGALLIIVGALAYGVKVIRDLNRAVHINPGLGEHLEAMEVTLKEIRDDLRGSVRRLEDIWQEVKK